MNLCSDNYEEVCYEGKKCPCCKLFEKVGELEDEIDGLNEEIRNLNEAD